MDKTLHQLGGLLLASVPSIITLVILHFWFRTFLFRPLQRVMQARRDRTEGQLEAARSAASRVEQMLASYESALQSARDESYVALDQRRKAAAEERSRVIAEARRQSDQTIAAAREQLAADVQTSRADLQRGIESIAARVTESVLHVPAGVHS